MKTITFFICFILGLGLIWTLKKQFSKNTPSQEVPKSEAHLQKLFSEYENVFGNNKTPETLKKLMAFDTDHQHDYNWGFELCTDVNKEPDRGQYSLDEEYFQKLVIFARADGTGSHYALWLDQTETSFENAPVIFLGSEGDIRIIASNIRELLVLLSFGPETLDGHFYKDLDEYDDPVHANAFRTWMKQELNIHPIQNLHVETSEEIEAITRIANEKYKQKFAGWMRSLKPQYEAFEGI